MLFVGYPWLYFFGNLNSYGLYGYTYFFPNAQSFIIGLANSSFQVSGLMAYVFRAIALHGVPVWAGHLVFGK